MKRSRDVIVIDDDEGAKGPAGTYVARPSKRIRPSRAPERGDASWTLAAGGKPVAQDVGGKKASFTPIRGPAAKAPPALSPSGSECWGEWKPA